jgi:hypothetical protein
MYESVITIQMYTPLKMKMCLSDKEIASKICSGGNKLQHLRNWKEKKGMKIVEDAITPEWYHQLSYRKELPDVQIAKIWQVDKNWLRRFKDYHNLVKPQFAIDKEGYLEMKEDGMSDEEIIEDFNLSSDKLQNMKKRWGIRSASETSYAL